MGKAQGHEFNPPNSTKKLWDMISHVYNPPGRAETGGSSKGLRPTNLDFLVSSRSMRDPISKNQGGDL